jgi:hypothetical protein
LTAGTKYDLAVAYRIYPKVAEPAKPLPGSDDKLLLSEVCLRSFKRSLGHLRAKLFVILDSCPPEYVDLFRRYFDIEDLVFLPVEAAGNYATFHKQIEVLLEQTDSEMVYFAEDDYFYLEAQFETLLDFLAAHSQASFVSPYDHLDCYTMSIHRERKWITFHGDHHWRTAASTCLTFLTQKRTLAETGSAFRKYSPRVTDFALWLSLTKRRLFNPFSFLRYAAADPIYLRTIGKAWHYGWPQILFGRRYQLWVPIPAIATHLCAQRLSPTIDWPSLMRTEVDELRLAAGSLTCVNSDTHVPKRQNEIPGHRR